MKIKDFKFRADLELYIKKNPSVESIEGSNEELARLQLSEKTTLMGIPCISTEPRKKRTQEKPLRGEQTDFGINNKVK